MIQDWDDQSTKEDFMKNKLFNKVLALTVCLAVGGTLLAGCGKLNDSDVVVTVGDSEVTADVANFYARYQQAQYETYLSSMSGGGADMWKNEISDGKTYEESVKESVMESIEQLYILDDHKKDYDVSVSDEEKKAITGAAKKFIKNNGLEEKEAISADQKTVENVLTLMTVSSKMNKAMTADVDTNVSDEEAAQKSMQYVYFPFTTTDDSGESKDLTDEEKEQLKKDAEQFAKDAETASDFEAFAKEKSYEAQTATFDAESTSPAEELIKAADQLTEGQVTGVVETENGYYVAKVTSLLDREATDTKKESIVQQRKQDQFDKLYKEWKKDTKISVDKKNWKKISFADQGVTVKQEESQPYTD